MLLVVFGAGASYDAFPRGGDFDFRPPLTDQLFNRHEFAPIRGHYPEAAGIATDLGNLPDGTSLEERMAELQSEAEAGYGRGFVEMAAIRFFLREATWLCSARTTQVSNSETSYAELLARLDRWSARRSEPVCFATFNYDRVLDTACRDILDMRFARIEDYVSANPRFSLLKLHGSCDWGRTLDDTRFPPDSYPNARELIAASADLKVGDSIVRSDDPPESGRAPRFTTDAGSNLPLFPAIALPVRNRKQFECPPEHQSALEAAVRDMTRLIVIGWRAEEEHFLKVLSQRSGLTMTMAIVNASERGCDAVAHSLKNRAGIGGSVSRHPGGFAKYLRTRSLEQYLG